MITNTDMAKMTNKPITSDLFQVDTCDDCKGSGIIIAEDERQDDCDTCNGTGIIQ